MTNDVCITKAAASRIIAMVGHDKEHLSELEHILGSDRINYVQNFYTKILLESLRRVMEVMGECVTLLPKHIDDSLFPMLEVLPSYCQRPPGVALAPIERLCKQKAPHFMKDKTRKLRTSARGMQVFVELVTKLTMVHLVQELEKAEETKFEIPEVEVESESEDDDDATQPWCDDDATQPWCDEVAVKAMATQAQPIAFDFDCKGLSPSLGNIGSPLSPLLSFTSNIPWN